MFSKIAVATDGSPLARQAVQAAANLAAQCGSELIVLHVLMHGEPPEEMRRMARVEHLIVDESQPQPAIDDIPSQMIAARADVERHRHDHAIVAAMGQKIVEQARYKAQESGVASVRGEVLEGDSAAAITAAVKRIGADLIVLGTRGLGPVKGLLMGSVSRKVSQEAGCACLIIK